MKTPSRHLVDVKSLGDSETDKRSQQQNGDHHRSSCCFHAPLGLDICLGWGLHWSGDKQHTQTVLSTHQQCRNKEEIRRWLYGLT